MADVNNKLIARNALMLYIRLFVLMLVSLYTSRIVLDVLGVTDFGVFNLVGSVIVVFSFLKASLSEATQRHLNFEIGKADERGIVEVFRTSVNCFAIIGVLSCAVAEIAWFFFGSSLNIPAERTDAAAFVFHVSLLSVFVGFLQIPFNASVIAHERMDFFAVIGIVEAVLKVLIVVGLYFVPFDKLKVYSLLLLLSTLLILLVNVRYCRRHFGSRCSYAPSWSRERFRQMFSFTSWSVMGSLAATLSDSGINVLLNLFFSVVINAAYGIAMQVNNIVNRFLSGYLTAFSPQLVKQYAAQNADNVKQLLFQASKYSFFLFFLISVPIIFNIDVLLNLWLNKVPPHTQLICQLILLGTIVDSASSPLYFAINATGRIRNYQLCIATSYFLHFLLSYLLLYAGFPFYSVLLLRLLLRGALNYMIGIFFVKRQLNISPREYFAQSLVPMFRVAVIPLLLSSAVMLLGGSGIVRLGASVVVFELSAMASILFLGMKESERAKVLGFAKAKFVNRKFKQDE